MIPNRKMVGDILHNYGKIRQRDIVVGVAYDTDMNTALAAIKKLQEQYLKGRTGTTLPVVP